MYNLLAFLCFVFINMPCFYYPHVKSVDENGNENKHARNLTPFPQLFNAYVDNQKMGRAMNKK